MAKTAEDWAEDLEFEFDKKIIAESYRQFAAQEVEAYRERIKKNIRARYEIGMLPISEIVKLIDAVK